MGVRASADPSISAQRLAAGTTAPRVPEQGLVTLLEEEIRRLPVLTGEAPGIADAAGHALRPGGKLLRPLLLVHSAGAVGGDPARVLPAAVGLECAHVGSLVHDDLIDHDDVRRGRAATHHRFGSATAIVTGNALFFGWFEALATCADRGISSRQLMRAMRIQAETGRQICEGAAREIAMAGRVDTPIAEYLEMTRLKTAVLTAAARRIGAVLAGVTPARTTALGSFGEALGAAFQIRDDLLPHVGDPAATGKPNDSDLRNQRPTLPVLLARDHATASQAAALRDAFASLPRDTACARIRQLVQETGALAHASRLAHDKTAEALAHLHRLPVPPPPSLRVSLTVVSAS
ncbi:polyprenyl synthetase family protein [Streptomyces sp. NPDC002586]